MEPYQERAIDEATELNVKVNALDNYLRTEAFRDIDDIDQELLQAQYTAMREYLDMLHQRIERFV